MIIPLRVSDEMQWNQSVVKHVSKIVRSRDIKGFPMVNYRLFIAVGFFESPLVWNCIVAVIKDS